jgi:uncharacterized damage-inducible protein DinB
MKQLLETYVEYNHWANRRLAEILVKLPEESLDKPVKSSFPSLRKTVHHIWDAELAWLARLRGETLPWPPSAQFESPSIADFVITSAGFVSYVEARHEDYFLEECEYQNIKGQRFVTPVYGIIMHCMNHSTFHRGQIITILRELGEESGLPSTDLIAYLRESKP